MVRITLVLVLVAASHARLAHHSRLGLSEDSEASAWHAESFLRRGQHPGIDQKTAVEPDNIQFRKHEENIKTMWPGVAMAAIAGASTVLGATVVLFMPEDGPPPSAMAFSLSLAAGVMIAVSVEMLIPHDPDGEHGEIAFAWIPFFVFLAGAVACALLCKLGDCLEGAIGKADLLPGDSPQSQQRSFRLAALLFVSLTLHNFPEGFAVAITALSGMRLGVTMCIAVAFHNIPEGIALAVSIYRVTKSYGQSFLWTFVSGLTEPLGALCAMMLMQTYLTMSTQLLRHLLTAVAGVMCYVAIAELLPEAISTRCWVHISSGFVAGVVVMVLTHWVMEVAIENGQLELQRHSHPHQQMLH